MNFASIVSICLQKLLYLGLTVQLAGRDQRHEQSRGDSATSR